MFKICVLPHRPVIQFSRNSRLDPIAEIVEATMLSNPRPRVLCVDDDEDCHVMLSTLLEIQLVEAKTVGTSAQALLAIQTEHFDLYSLDSRLPDRDGFELCRPIRAVEPYAPILFFSGAAYEADKKLGIAAGANGYVIKPDIHGVLRSFEYFLSIAQSSFTQAIPRDVEAYSLALSALKLRESLSPVLRTPRRNPFSTAWQFPANTPYGA